MTEVVDFIYAVYGGMMSLSLYGFTIISQLVSLIILIALIRVLFAIFHVR